DIAYQDKTAYYTDNGIKITEDHIIRTDNLNGTTTITLVNDAEDDTAVAKKDGPVNPNLIDVYAHEINFGFPINLAGEPESSIIDLGWGGGSISGTAAPQAPQDVVQVEDEPPSAVDPPAKDATPLAQNDEDALSNIEEIIIAGHRIEPDFPATISYDFGSSTIDLDWDSGGTSGTDAAPDDIAEIENEDSIITNAVENDAALAQEEEIPADLPQEPENVAAIESEPTPVSDSAQENDALAQTDEDTPSVIEEITLVGHNTEPNDALQSLIDDANDARSFGEKVTDAVSNVLDAATQMVGATVDAVIETAAELGSVVVQTVIDLIKDPSSLGEKVTNAAASTAEAITQLADASANGVVNLDLGLLKGLGNLPGDLFNFVVATFKYGSGFMGVVNTIEEHALAAYNDGDVAQANKLAAQAELLREKWQVDDLFTLDNTAQKIGSLLSAVVPIAEVAKVAGVVGKAAQEADKLVDTAKVVDEAGDTIHILDAAESAAPFSQIVPGGGLAAHEAAGGHLLINHVGQTESQLMTRLTAEPGITGSSSFYNRTAAEAAVSNTLDANASNISTWLSGSSGRLRIDYVSPNPVGISISRDVSNAIDVSSTRIILVRDPSLATGYRIQTGFPTK
ncbi:MAG: hypothetical protein LBF16_11380, partial [Pseudomonadales bacterium]|nr:hypothetical protein [Pseudomonadales bacterium]